MDKGQQGQFTKDEIALLTKFVQSRPDATILLRNHFLQLGVSPADREFLKSLTPEVLNLVQKFLLPTLSPDVPLTLQANMYSRLEFIGQYSTEGAILHIKTNDLIIDYLEQQFKTLKSDVGVEGIALRDLPNGPLGSDQIEQRVINTLAYNKIVPLVEERIYKMNAIGTPPAEMSEEEKKAKQKANSSK